MCLLTNYLYIILNSDSIGHSIFLPAKSDNPTHETADHQILQEPFNFFLGTRNAKELGKGEALPRNPWVCGRGAD
jgi:hypothetical protein